MVFSISEGCPSLVTAPVAAGRGGRQPRLPPAVPPDPDAWLALRDEYQQAKRRERAAEDKIKQLAAQLMRTEEAAKRILTRTDPSARGGCAQRLLDAEREVCRLKAALAEAESALAAARRQGADSCRQASEHKQRLEAALASQRSLALQLGRAQAGRAGSPGPGRGLAALSASALLPPRSSSPTKAGSSGATGAAPRSAAAEAEAEAEAAAAARRFAVQQEQLVGARERCGHLEQQLQQREALLTEQAQQLAGLRAQLAGGGSHGCAAHQGYPAGGASSMPPPPRRRTSGSGGGGSEEQWLRLKVLKSQSAIDALQRSNSRLLAELESVRSRCRELQQAADGASQPAGAGPPPVPAARHGLDSADVEPDTALQLRRQLAEANHRAARLQIELDAASAKLAIYQEHRGCMGPQTALAIPADEQAHLAELIGRQAGPRSQQTCRQVPSQQQVKGSVRAERVASWVQAHATVATPAAGAPLVPGQLAEHANLVELHLHAASLDAAALALPPPALTVLSVDLPGFESKLTALGEGLSPSYGTSLEFVCPQTQLFCDHVASGSARVQLHACRASSGGGGATEYDTLASADIPLRALLQPGGVRQYQRCELVRSDGRPCGTLQYALAALRPVHPHPAANVLAAAAPAQPLSSSAGAGAGPRRPPRLAVRVVGCRSLRPPQGTSSGSGLRSYVALMLPEAAAAAGRQAVFETRPATASGTDPAFEQQAVFDVSQQAAARGLTLEAAVFDDAGGSGANAVIGVARIACAPPSAASSGGGASATTLQPLLHPGSGRHAGVLELAVGWE